MSWKEDIDYPISYGFYRAVCWRHGETVPPKLGDLYLPSEEEHRQTFIDWQNKQQRRAFGYSASGEDRKEPEQPWTKDQWGAVQQLRAEVKYLHGKVNESGSKPKTKKDIL